MLCVSGSDEPPEDYQLNVQLLLALRSFSSLFEQTDPERDGLVNIVENLAAQRILGLHSSGEPKHKDS